MSQVGPATPDHTIYTKRLPCFVPTRRTRRDPAATWAAVERAVERFVRDYTAYVDSPPRPRGRAARPAARAWCWCRGWACSRPGATPARPASSTTSTTTRSPSSATPPPSAATSRSRPGTPSTSSTGRSSSTSSRWRRPRRSWPGASRSSPAAAPASAAPWRSGWPPRARTWRSPTSTPTPRGASPTRSTKAVGGGRALGLGDGRHQRGLGAGGLRGHRAGLGRARHPRLQRRHRPLRRRSTGWRWPTGSARSR